MDIRENVASIIRERAFVQAGIARRAGLTPMQLGQTLRGKRRLETGEFLRICDALGMLPEDVIQYSARQVSADEVEEGEEK